MKTTTLAICLFFTKFLFSQELSENDLKLNNSELNMSKSINNLIDLPDLKDPLVVRTYFKNDKDWNIISKKLIDNYEMGFKANIEFLNDKQFENALIEDIIKKSKLKYKHNFIFIADSLTFSNAENSVLCIDLHDEIGKSFRVIPSELWGVENNLSISNMDFYEFFDSCDSDGVFRGFK
jgi:hypothetical protein